MLCGTMTSDFPHHASERSRHRRSRIAQPYLLILLAVALASSLVPVHSQAAQSPRILAHPPQDAPERPATISFADGVTGMPSLTYAQPQGYRPLTLDLYLPPKSAPKPEAGFPLILFIHGGAWMVGDPRKLGAFEDFPAVLASVAARGYVVASISYRLSGEAKFPAQIVDVRSAIRWMRARADLYDIDPARAVAWGVSAGGHLAALAATSCQDMTFDPAEPAPPSGPLEARPRPATVASPCVQGAVAWYGAFDLATIAAQARSSRLAGAIHHDEPGAAEWQLLGCGLQTCDPEQLKRASPAQQVTQSTPPMLLITGTADRIIPAAQTMEMATALRTAGVQVTEILMKDIDHSLLGQTPEATRSATLQALDATISWIDERVGSGDSRQPSPTSNR